MHFDIHHRYDASPAAVRAMLDDPDFWQSTLKGAVETCQVTPVTDGIDLRASLLVPAKLKRLAGNTVQLALQAVWRQDGEGWTGPITIDTGKLPGSFNGSSTIAADGDGCSVTYVGDFTIRIPLLGKTLEQQAGPYLTSVLNRLQTVGTTWVKTHPAPQ